MNRPSWPVRVRELAVWLFPIVFLLWLYREGVDIWFMQDDFAWLGLLRQVHSGSDVIRVLFQPAAQGTIRPWSERGFFLLLEALFGVDNLPFRIVVFATAAADLLLIGWIVRRITRSPLAGAVAGIARCGNASLVTVMTWSSAFNEVLCPFFLLSALLLFIRYAETGRKAFWWSQAAVFVLGFGALEINIVYPALAVAWILFVHRESESASPRRTLLLSQAPLAIVSAGYYALHRVLAPLPATGSYKLHFDVGILKTLAIYVRWALLPADWEARQSHPQLGKIVLFSGLTSLVLLAIFEVRRRRRVSLFFMSWFLITLAPLLPLPGHRTDYYLTIPVVGVGMLAGWSISCAWKSPGRSSADRRWQIIPVLSVLLYLGGMVPVARSATQWWSIRAEQVRVLVLGVDAARRAHPDAALMVDGVTTDLFNNGVGHSPFYPLGIDRVYLSPGSENSIRPVPDLADLRDVVLEPAVVRHALTQGTLVVYSISGDHLRNITEEYRRSAPERLADRLPDRVDLGNPLYSWLAGPEWLPLENGFRWMPGRATVRMRGPDVDGMKLSVDGYAPEEQLARSPRTLAVSVDDIVLGQAQIKDPESTFHRLFPLPPQLAGRGAVEVKLQVTPVEQIGNRELGLVISRVAIVR